MGGQFFFILTNPGPNLRFFLRQQKLRDQDPKNGKSRY